jgi:hypothetical protein
MESVFLQNVNDSNVFGNGEMDVLYDASGHLRTVTGNEKLRFIILKCVLTAYQGAPYNFGSIVPRLIGVKQAEFIRALIAASVSQAVLYFKDNQKKTAPAAERIESIYTIEVVQNVSEKTVFQLYLEIEVADGNRIAIVHSFQIW